jgi:hypothetical protein
MTTLFPLRVFTLVSYFVSSEGHVGQAVNFQDMYSGSSQPGQILFRSAVILTLISLGFSQANAGMWQ